MEETVTTVEVLNTSLEAAETGKELVRGKVLSMGEIRIIDKVI